ncbi:uncharacterized protein LOC111999633 [Quercus suber]
MLFRPRSEKVRVRVWIESDCSSEKTTKKTESISKALAGADRKDLMRKLPKFIYDEEKTLERTRKILTEKITQLNLAIDDVFAQLYGDDAPNGAAMNSNEVGASM